MVREERGSELARLMAQLDLENEAARRALYDPSLGTAQHEFITARMERMGQIQEELEKLVGPEQAAMLVVKAMERKEGQVPHG
jgi:hypothetical protein